MSLSDKICVVGLTGQSGAGQVLCEQDISKKRFPDN